MIPAIVIALVLLIAGARSLIVVPDDSAYVIERLGRFHVTLQAGVHLLLPFIDRVAFRYSLLPKSENLSDQCITRDNVCVEITSAFQWQIVDPQKAAYNVAGATDFVVSLVRSSQRQWIGERSWSDARETTRELQQAVLRSVAEPAAGAGVKIATLTIERIERVAEGGRSSEAPR